LEHSEFAPLFEREIAPVDVHLGLAFELVVLYCHYYNPVAVGLSIYCVTDVAFKCVDSLGGLDVAIDETIGGQLPGTFSELGIGIHVVDGKLGQCDSDQEVLLSIGKRHRWR